MMRTLRLLFVAVAVSVQMVAMADDSGKCGENLTWTYNESTKTLTINGNGETYSYTEYKKSPWKNYRSSIVNISIEAGITSIGSYVFEGISNLVSITFPNSLTFVEDKTSGIDAILRVIENKPVNKYYGLQGRKVKNTKNGLYIVEGKKVIIR